MYNICFFNFALFKSASSPSQKRVKSRGKRGKIHKKVAQAAVRKTVSTEKM